MNKENEQPEVQDKIEEKESEKDKPPKFKFECTRCGACCQNRDSIPITFTDLARWTKTGSFMQIILPHLELQSFSEADEFAKIALIPVICMINKDENGKGTCPFYDSENKMCNIYFTIPVNCKSFPLSYNGTKFYVSDPSCEGIGKGDMTKEKLLEMREISIRDYNERAETSIAMVPLQGLFIRNMMEQTQSQFNRLSKEDQEKLDELIKKTQTEEEEKTEDSKKD